MPAAPEAGFRFVGYAVTCVKEADACGKKTVVVADHTLWFRGADIADVFRPRGRADFGVCTLIPTRNEAVSYPCEQITAG